MDWERDESTVLAIRSTVKPRLFAKSNGCSKEIGNNVRPKLLREDLGHLDRRIRFEAQWELARRGDVETLLTTAGNTELEMRNRLHAIWGADQVARVDPEQAAKVLTSLRALMTDSDPVIRAAAAKVAGERGDVAAIPQLRELIKDASPRVRYFAVMALGNRTARIRLRALLASGRVRQLRPGDTARGGHGLRRQPGCQTDRVAQVTFQRIGAACCCGCAASPRSGRAQPVLERHQSAGGHGSRPAIYDEPIPVAMNSLAELIDGPGGDTELLRRSLNANFRLGSADSAARLAEFAARATAPPEMRVEALNILDAWPRPDPRDRVLNAYRPIAARPMREAADALAPHIESLMAGEPTVREEAIRVASMLGIKSIAPLLLRRVQDEQLSEETRATAHCRPFTTGSDECGCAARGQDVARQ